MTTERNDKGQEPVERERSESAYYSGGLWTLPIDGGTIVYGMPDYNLALDLGYYIVDGYRPINAPGLGAIRIAPLILRLPNEVGIPSRTTTLNEAVRMVEAIAVGVEVYELNDPNSIKSIVRAGDRVEAIRSKAMADYALELVKGIASTDPSVTTDQIERLERAEARMKSP